MITILLFIIGFIVLIKSADFLVEGASSIALKFKISKLVIGLTVVAMGTSMPELFVNIFAAVNNTPQIAIGNILGSNIANILLILGISSIIYPLSVTKGTIWKEIPFSLLAALVIGIMANDILFSGSSVSTLSLGDAVIFLFFFIIYLYYTFSIARGQELAPDSATIEQLPLKTMSSLKSLIFVIIGIAGLGLGGKWIVDGAVWIATALKVNERIIGLTIVAVGTSLPELATSAMAAYKKNADIAVGNVVGSNIFNIFFILGVSGLIKPLPFTSANNTDILVCLGATFLLFLSMFTGKKASIDRWEGILFLVAYIAYLLMLIFMK